MKTRIVKTGCAAVCALLLAALLAVLSAPAAVAAPPASSTGSAPQQPSAAEPAQTHQINRRYFISEANMTLSVPADYYVLTPGMAASDAALDALGLTLEEAQALLVQAEAQLEAYSPDFTGEIKVSVVPFDEYGTMNGLTEKEKDEFLQGFEEALNNAGYGFYLEQSEWLQHAGRDYVKLYVAGTWEQRDDKIIELATIRNYKVIAIAVNAFRPKGTPLQASQAEEQEALAQRILESISFTDKETVSTPQRSDIRDPVSRVAYRFGQAIVYAFPLGLIFAGVRRARRKKRTGDVAQPEEKPAQASEPSDREAAAEPAPVGAAAADTGRPPAGTRPPVSPVFCGKCGKPIPGDTPYCPYCAAPVKLSFDEVIADAKRRAAVFAEAEEHSAPKRLCQCCGSLLPDNRIYCVVCGAKYGDPPPKKKRIALKIVIAAAIIAALVLTAALSYRPVLQGMVRQAEAHAAQREFTAGYEKLERFEKLNHPALGLDTDVDGYRVLKEYLLAGKYYEEGIYREALYYFEKLGNYREAPAMAEACRTHINAGSP